MKEASGEGSMTLITILIIAGIAVIAGVIVTTLMTKTQTTANNFSVNVNGKTYN